MSVRKIIREFWEPIDLETDIDNAIAILQELKNDGWEGLEVQYGYEHEHSLCPYKTRLENNAEYQKRINEEESEKAYRKRHYEELKKEFEE